MRALSQTFAILPSSIPQEKVMGSVGLTLPWEHKLSAVARDGERLVEPFEGKAETVRISEELPHDEAVSAACLGGNLPENSTQHLRFSRAIFFCHLDVPHPGQHLPRFAPQPRPPKGPGERRRRCAAPAQGTPRPWRSSFSPHGART